MNAQALPTSRGNEPRLIWTRNNPLHGLNYQPEEKEQLLIPIRELAWEITRQGHYKLSGEREWKQGNKTLFFLKNMQEGLQINGEAVKEYLLLVASHESTGKSFLATFHFPVQRGNRFARKVAPLFIHPSSGEELRQNALRMIRQYESSRQDLYRLLNRFDAITASEELIEEIRYHVVHALQKNFQKMPTYSGRGIVAQINAFDNLLAIERKGRKHTLKTLFNAITAFTTHHLDTSEPANAEGLGAELNLVVINTLERELMAEMAESYS